MKKLALILLSLLVMSGVLSGAPGAAPDPEAPVISGLKTDPANPRVGQPYKVQFQIVALKAPPKKVILEWAGTNNSGKQSIYSWSNEITKFDKAIKDNKFTLAITKSVFSNKSYNSKYTITAQLIDEKDRKSEVIEYKFEVN